MEKNEVLVGFQKLIGLFPKRKTAISRSHDIVLEAADYGHSRELEHCNVLLNPVTAIQPSHKGAPGPSEFRSLMGTFANAEHLLLINVGL